MAEKKWFLAIAILYLLIAWVILPPKAFWSPDEGVRLMQLHNLRLDDGQFLLDIQYQGRDLDPDLQYAPTAGRILVARDGKLYFPRLPIFSLLSLPLFHLLGFKGLYLLPALSGALICACALSLIHSHYRQIPMGLLIAFGSPVAIYSVLFWEHTLATALCLLATWLALRGFSGERKVIWVGVGLLLAISVYLRLETGLYAAALILACTYAVWRKGQRITGPFVSGIVVLLLLIPYFPLQRTLFPYVYRPLTYIRQGRWLAIPYFLLGPPGDEGFDFGWRGILFSALVMVAILLSIVKARKSKNRYLRWAYLLSLGAIALLSGWFLFTPGYRSSHGFLLSTPWALLGICRVPEIWRIGDWRGRILSLTALIGSGAYMIAILLIRGTSPQGGLEWGARFALTLYPLLAILTMWPFPPQERHAATYVIWAAFFLLGAGFQLRGLRLIRNDKMLIAQWNQTITSLSEEALVTDVWWLPFLSVQTFNEKPFFVVKNMAQLEELAFTLTQEEADSFCLITLEEDTARAILDLPLPEDVQPVQSSLANMRFICTQIHSTDRPPHDLNHHP